MRLTKQESDILAGKEGEAQRIAMSILVEIGSLYGANEMIGITQAHCDTSFYVSEAGLEFVEHLANLGAKASVPASTNASLIDMKRWREYRASTGLRDIHRRIEKVHRRLGIAPTYTCAPYQAGLVPRFGEQIAWTESNAIAFANSVIGARTNRYGDLMDICAAIIGKVPGFDLHLVENRKAEIIIRLKDFSDEIFMDSSVYPLLGYVTGEIAGDRVSAIEGIPANVKTDHLKGFSAAAAASGGVGLFHIIGLTPEAQTLEMCLTSNGRPEIFEVTPQRIQTTKNKLWTAKNDSVDLVAMGCPHFSWANMVTQLAGTCHKIDSISGTARFNINDYGVEVAKSYFVGDSVDEFNLKIEKYGLPSNALKYCVELICADMELIIKNVVESCEPIVGDADMYVKSWTCAKNII